MVEDFEGYSEEDVEALKSLGLLDPDLVDKKVPEVKGFEFLPNDDVMRVKGHPNIVIKKNRQNVLYVSREEAQFFGDEKTYIQFIKAECRNPKNTDLIVKGPFKDLSYFQNIDPDIFNGKDVVVENNC